MQNATVQWTDEENLRFCTQKHAASYQLVKLGIELRVCKVAGLQGGCQLLVPSLSRAHMHHKKGENIGESAYGEMANAKKNHKDKNNENKSKMTLRYDGKQQHWNKVELNFQVSWENDYKGGVLVIPISYDTNFN